MRTNPYDHPESPERLAPFSELIRDLKIDSKKPVLVDEQYIHNIHDPAYVEYVKRLSESHGVDKRIDVETPVGVHTFEIARLSLSSAVTAADYAISSNGTVFSIARPPGHHASRTYSRGFCIFNNAATAVYRVLDHGLNRILIFDFDAHFGDGTYDILLYMNKDVLLLSLDEDCFSNDRMGFIDVDKRKLHASVPRSSGPSLARMCKNAFFETYSKYKPEAVVISMGLDAHFADPVSGLNLSIEDYLSIAETIRDACIKVPTIFVLEGGYNPPYVRGALSTILSVWDERFPHETENVWTYEYFGIPEEMKEVKKRCESLHDDLLSKIEDFPY